MTCKCMIAEAGSVVRGINALWSEAPEACRRGLQIKAARAVSPRVEVSYNMLYTCSAMRDRSGRQPAKIEWGG